MAGDGAGMLLQLPDVFFRSQTARLNINLPEQGSYAVGMVFLPRNADSRAECEKILTDFIVAEGQTFLGWRDVPVDNTSLGISVKAMEPVIRQVFVGRGGNCADQNVFERKLFVIRKLAENTVRKLQLNDGEQFYLTSLSSRTITYKGMLLADQLGMFYPDLRDESMLTALALVHQRFSTNTFPTWNLAHPFRMIAHNGEINTVRGNVNWMAARRQAMASEILGEDLHKIWPLIDEHQSDSACFDNALELLVAGGYSLAHAMMLLIPEAWAGNPLMDDNRRAFYEYHAALMEPWDGPAAVAFTDGCQIGATLDRNGLRPARYLVTSDDFVLMASEMGVLDVPEHKIVKKWRLQPGKMLLIDTVEGRIVDDAEIKSQLAGGAPYQDWLNKTQILLKNLPQAESPISIKAGTLLKRQQAFGYTQEDIKVILKPMGASGQEPVGSMGIDAAPAVLSSRSRLLYDYFKQGFAQVTNPAIDPIREELVMSLVSLVGPRPNLLGLKGGDGHMRLEVQHPALSNQDLEKIRHIEHTQKAFRTRTLSICYTADQGASGMEKALERLCSNAEQSVLENYNILILSDRAMDIDHIAIPALLATSAVHHHLIRVGLRTSVGLVVETGEAREVHHFCLLAGFRAEAVNPYLALDSLSELRAQLPDAPSEEEVQKRYIKAVDKGILKVMSKMGISTYQSYCGAQIFNAIGLSEDFLDKYFTGSLSTIGGVGIREIADETVLRHRLAYSDAPCIVMPWMQAGNMPIECEAKTMFGRLKPLQNCSTRRAPIMQLPMRNTRN